jgi:hypothetical protein
MFRVPRHFFGDTEGIQSCFHIFRSRKCFRRYRGRQVPFSCFARPDSFSAILRASNPIFMFSSPGHVFSDTEGVGSRFHVLRYQTHFRRYRVCRVPFSCFALHDNFLAVPSASGPVFMFCAPGQIFGSTEGVGSRFHILRSRTRSRRYRERRFPLSCFARSDSFLTEPRTSGPVFIFCAPGFIFGGTEGVKFRFHVLRARTLCRRYRGRRILFSFFSLLDMFSAVPWASGAVFMFCATRLIFGGTEGIRSHFNFSRSRACFRRFGGRRLPISCFALPASFSTVPRVSVPVFMFCMPELIFGGPEGVGSRFHILRVRARFGRYRVRRVLFSCFARPNSFSAVQRASNPFSCFSLSNMFSAVPSASGPIFMFCTTGFVFNGTEGVGSRFHV